MTESQLALQRDLSERKILAELSKEVPGLTVTFTDGPMELWSLGEIIDPSSLRHSLEEYKAALMELCQLGVVTAGYVDKPAANLVVRLLELATLEEDELPDVKRKFPLRGVTDFWIFRELLSPGERSAVFGTQMKSAQEYSGDLSLGFFYLNVGLPNKPWIARIDVPAWVIKNEGMLDTLHAVLIDQCRIMGQRSYPYLLHRAHETAVVTMQEKEQVTRMVMDELHRRGLEVGEISQKSGAKSLQGRTRYRG